MTRINLVDPSHLTNKHLIAEYRELPRVFTAVRKLIWEPNLRVGDGWRNFIDSYQFPEQYVLGEGHVKFFYNKLPWLVERYRSICYELRTKRNFTLDKDLYEVIYNDAKLLISSMRYDQLQDWQPSPEEIYLNMARICKRSKIDRVLNEINC